MGFTDMAISFILAIIVEVLYTNVLIELGVLTVVATLTSFIGFCPLYFLLASIQ